MALNKGGYRGGGGHDLAPPDRFRGRSPSGDFRIASQ